LNVADSLSEKTSTVRILGAALALCAVLLVIRANVVGFAWNDGLPALLAAAYYDFLFVAGVTLLFLVMVRLTKNRPAGSRTLVWLYWMAAVFILAAALGNVAFIRVVGRPFNYQWLYYSDFLRSTDSQQAIRGSVSWRAFLFGMVATVAMVGVTWLFTRGVGRVRRTCRTGGRFALCMAVPCLVYFPCAAWGVHRVPWKRPKMENAIVAFLESVVARPAPSLFTMKTMVGAEDFLITAERKTAAPPATNAAIRNVILFVLESVPAEYVEVCGGKYPVTPTLSRYRKHAAIFRNIYAHAPATNKSMLSMLCSIYPWISHLSLTSEHPDATIPSLTSELKARGYRTAFFSSSDNHFQSADKFLEHRGFDVVQDYRARECKQGTFVDPDWNKNFLNGIDDECATDLLIEWVNAKADEPFFGMMWTMMTHYPYFVTKPETLFDVNDPYFNRYLNALRHGDYCLGKVLAALEAKRLVDSTLVVVVGDHGEAFGRHDQYTHACKIYDENVRVPLILINPRLFHGEENPAIGGLIDIAPTVTELMNLPAAGSWQGRSLLNGGRPERAYFFAAWSEFMFGYREGDRKCIFNATANTFEVYDLRADPLETKTLADQSPEVVQMIPQRLAAWLQYQDKLIKTIIAEERPERVAATVSRSARQ
jgi:phosphoglycerol transferase MdoB-like AlkP superfamily enzyme